jgi:Chromo (CHRromatin Organisation MOdifier) domain
VLLSTEGISLRGGNNKLCARYLGPFEVTAVVNANAYTLALPPQLEALHPTFNIDKLKPYRDGRARFPDRPQRYARPPPEAEADSNGDQKFVVEEVLASRRRGRNGPSEYLVAWRGYPPEENTWEPRSSLADGAAEALALFERRQQASED